MGSSGPSVPAADTPSWRSSPRGWRWSSRARAPGPRLPTPEGTCGTETPLRDGSSAYSPRGFGAVGRCARLVARGGKGEAGALSSRRCTAARSGPVVLPRGVCAGTAQSCPPGTSQSPSAPAQVPGGGARISAFRVQPRGTRPPGQRDRRWAPHRRKLLRLAGCDFPSQHQTEELDILASPGVGWGGVRQNSASPR